MDQTYIKKIKQRYEALSSDFSEAQSRMNNIYKFVLPNKYDIKDQIDRPQGDQIPVDVYDSTMSQDADMFASGIHGYLMNQSSRWFAMETQNKKQMYMNGVRKYFEDVENVIYSILDNSNFYYESREAVNDLNVGNFVLYGEEHPELIVNFTAIEPTICVWEESITGRVNAVYRLFKYTPQQMYEKWGDACSDKVLKMLDSAKSTEKVSIIHCCRPRWQRDRRKKDKTNKPFESIYFEKEGCHLLSESGYDKFPFFVVRYIKNSGQVIGYGPGHFALPEALTLNEAMKNEILSQQLDVNPVKSAPSASFLLPILSDPGAINYRTSDNPNDKIDYFTSGANHQANDIFMDGCRKRIDAAFHKDYFLAISDATKRMTIPEVQERISEKMPMLGSGSGIARLLNEGLAPIIEWVYYVASKKKLLPPVPEALKDATYKTVFISQLAKAQKVSEIRGLQSTIQLAATVAQLKPEVLDNYNLDKMCRDGNELFGGKAEYLNELDEVAKSREIRARQQAEQMRKQELLMAAEGAEKSSKADLNLSKASQA